ncbi:hypothetical protein BGZ54_004342 [Gamsiella multidivaricata]|nr:hypothetical protein BGZ54_004342 [Gamsiella multidivaricata]
MDQIVAIQQNHTPVDIQQGAAKDTDLQGVGQDKRPTTPYELLLIDIHLVPLDPARPSELLLSKIPLSVLRARFHLRTEISPGWYRLEIHFWDKGRNSDHQGTTTTEALDKHGVWDLSTSSLVQSPGVAKSMAFDSIQAREVGIWRGAEAIEVTTLSPEFKEWSEFVATTSDKVHQERWSAVDAGEFDSVIYSQQEQQQQHQRSTYENPFQLSKAARGFSAELHDMIMGLIYGVGRADATSFERADFPQETFRFKEAMDIMTGRDMAPDFVDEELEEMQEEGSIGKDVQETWNTAIEQLNGLMTVWDDTSPDNADDDVMDQNESYGAPSTDLIDFGVRIEHGREIIQPWTSTTWRANRDRTVSWQTSDGLVRDRMLLAVELIKAPDVSVEAGSVTGTRVRTRAELAKESLKQPCEAVLTDRVPASWGAVVVRMPTWVLTGAYQLRLKGVGGQGTEWADVSQPFVVQSDPYLYY